MRSVLKRAAERALIGSGAAHLHRRRMSGRALILAYHNIVPDDTPPAGDLANHLPLSSFVAQLDALTATHDVVPLADTLAEPRHRAGRPRAAITFDDAYRGAVVHGVAELVRRGLPATLFVAPAFLGGTSFWWDVLARRGEGGLDAAVRTRALHDLRGRDDAVREWAERSGHGLAAMPDVSCAASEEELARAAAAPGITLGSHTWSHPNLTRLEARELAAELVKPLAWLRQHVARPLPWIAYPYGLFSDEVARAAAAAGYEAALGVSGGWLSREPSDRFALPRLNIPPGLSIEGFILRGAGLLSM